TLNLSNTTTATSVALSTGNLSPGANTLTVSGTFNQSGGTFTQGTGAITLNGVSNTFGGTFTKEAGGSGSLVFSGGVAQSLSANGRDLGNVTVSGVSTVVTVSSQTITFDNVSVTASGQLNLDAASSNLVLNLNSGKTLTNSSTVQLANASTNKVFLTGV